jgi:negative regulator of flagellin synthesis FlgM
MDDELVLSDTARSIAASEAFDREKVEAIKLAISEGNYPLDSRRIAENFLALERLL